VRRICYGSKTWETEATTSSRYYLVTHLYLRQKKAIIIIKWFWKSMLLVSSSSSSSSSSFVICLYSISVVREWWIGKDVEEGGRGLISAFAWTDKMIIILIISLLLRWTGGWQYLNLTERNRLSAGEDCTMRSSTLHQALLEPGQLSQHSACLRTRRPGDRGSIPAEARGLLSKLFVQTGSAPTQPPVQWLPRVISQGVKRGRGLALTTHSHLVPRSWMSRSYIQPLPPAPP
jgi:hypothetical protein